MRDSLPSQFSAFFQKFEQPAQRGKFLSRLFGIFNEELVRFWTGDERSPYRDLGRPTIFNGSDEKGSTLDFTFEDRTTKKRFVVEMKCEIEFQGYRFMTLSDAKDLSHHKKPAFNYFLSLARDSQSCGVRVKGQSTEVAGAILIWGDVNEAGRVATIADCGFHDIIGMNRIVEDLWLWQPEPFVAFLQDRGSWSNELFEFLIGKEMQMPQIFKHNDSGYTIWRDSHQTGFICNISNAKGEQSWKPICAHKASCHQLARDKNGEKPWTTEGYYKICADDLQTIEGYIRNNAIKLPVGWHLRLCKKCTPSN